MNPGRVEWREPREDQGVPEWYHHHGFKMRLKLLDLDHGLILISGSAATLIIRKGEDTWSRGEYLVEWEVIQCRPLGEYTRGSIRFAREELRAAFRLSERSGCYGRWLIERYGGETAQQGKFIRWEKFLNIPCPGTGHDGDPNISIMLDHRMQKAVQKLIES